MLPSAFPWTANYIVSGIWDINIKIATAIVSAERMAMEAMAMHTAKMVTANISLPVCRRMSAAEQEIQTCPNPLIFCVQIARPKGKPVIYQPENANNIISFQRFE